MRAAAMQCLDAKAPSTLSGNRGLGFKSLRFKSVSWLGSIGNPGEHPDPDSDPTSLNITKFSAVKTAQCWMPSSSSLQIFQSFCHFCSALGFVFNEQKVLP